MISLPVSHQGNSTFILVVFQLEETSWRCRNLNLDLQVGWFWTGVKKDISGGRSRVRHGVDGKEQELSRSEEGRSVSGHPVG